MNLLVIANPLPATGGNYRARKSLLEYPRYGIKPYLIVPSSIQTYRSSDALLELTAKGVEILEVLENKAKGARRHIRNLVQFILPQFVFKVSPKVYKYEVDAVLGFHEVWEVLWLSYAVAEKLEKPSIVVLQLPPFYKKSRLKAIKRAIKLYYDNLYGGMKKEMINFYRTLLVDLSNYNSKKILDKISLKIGISKAICEETGYESEIYCMNPGVSLDDTDLALIGKVNEVVKEKRNFIIFGGRPDALKGIVEGLLAFKHITTHLGGNFKLYITGNISDLVKQRIIRFSKRLGILDNIVLTGYISREERLKLVKEAKVMIYPSHIDGYPYAIVESLLLNTPVVAYNIPAIEIYFKSLNGVKIVKEFDVEALSSETINILTQSRVDVDIPRLRSWHDIIEEEIKLISSIIKKY